MVNRLENRQDECPHDLPIHMSKPTVPTVGSTPVRGRIVR